MHSSDKDTNAPITHFANCHLSIFAQLSRLGDLPALLGPATHAQKNCQRILGLF